MIYLNNAASSFPKHPTVLDAVHKALDAFPNDGRRGGKAAVDIDGIRARLATFFGAPRATDLIFTSGATESINLVVNGLSLERAHVVTTAIEHNSVLRPLKRLEDEGRISLTVVPCLNDGRVEAQTLLAHLRPDTALVALSHASNVTGTVQLLTRLSATLRSKKIFFLLDASQSAGWIDIDVSKTPIDALVFTGHKWMGGISGVGGLVLRSDRELHPLKVGGTGTHSESLIQPDRRPDRYEAGTPNLAGIASLGASLAVIGTPAYRQQKYETTLRYTRLHDALSHLPRLTLQSPRDAQVPTLSFTINGFSPDDVAMILERSYGMVVRSGLHCAPLIHSFLGTTPEGSVRLSLSTMTTDADIDAIVSAISTMVNDMEA